MNIKRLDHIVLTVTNIEKSCAFYSSVLNMEVKEFKNGRKALHFGKQKINLHQVGKEFSPKAHKPTPGSADLCFITDDDISGVQKHFLEQEVCVVEGPVERTGAIGRIVSLYIRDPDSNLIEIAKYV